MGEIGAHDTPGEAVPAWQMQTESRDHQEHCITLEHSSL